MPTAASDKCFLIVHGERKCGGSELSISVPTPTHIIFIRISLFFRYRVVSLQEDLPALIWPQIETYGHNYTYLHIPVTLEQGKAEDI